MKRDLMVGVAQWLSTPGEPKQNLAVALGMMDDAASRGVELLVLPELWSCGYDPETLGDDAWRDAEPRDGPRSATLADRARQHGLFVAGSMPELGEDGSVYDTMLVFDPHGALAAWHRKAHLYRPAREHAVFAPGDRVTTFDIPSLGRVGLVVGFEGDFPEVARSLALRGARLVLAACACEVEAAPAWDLLHPAYALANSQWWLEANQAGTHAASTLLGASRIIAPTGTVVAAAPTAVPGRPSAATLVVHRIDLHLAHRRDSVGALLEEERRPALYGGLVDGAVVA
ncbi:MAG TPA: carbon-nitrogen hydrolase family protein [Acidimicrobiales bacterium]|nr:carbon-nitrogen hydrolase family protein [Acidimicrobiales bacterium]